jgi:hypothetical protein
MTGVVQFVALDVPHCTLTYSVLPCRAQTGFDVAGGAPTNGAEPNAVGFGTDTFAHRNGGLTGAADGKQATGSFWFFANANTGGNQTLFAGETTLNGATTRFSIRLVSGIFRITGTTSAGTLTLDMRNTTAIQSGSWYHTLFSFDLTSTALRHLYIDDVSSLNAVTYANNAIDYTLADWSFGALADGTEHIDDETIYADFWLSLNTYVDFSVAANRRKFISANGNPVYLGTIGQAPGFGTPLVYFGNAGTAFKTNLGTGGGFTTVANGTEYAVGFATGSRKCFNSVGTCQDLENFTEETVTLLFSENIPLVSPIAATVYPFIKTVDYQPAIVSLEGQIGQRASLKIVFRDAPHSDAGPSFDKYPSSRGYDPYTRGTFWGKFRARNPYMRGRQIRLYIGEAEQSLAALETRYFIIDSMAGPTPEGEFTITAQDILKFASGDRIVTPPPSSGFLTADITTGNINISIGPSGALADPNNFYGTDGFACIGGSEIVHYQNISGDNVDLDARGIFNTEEGTHSAQDRFQLCLAVEPSDPADVLQLLLQFIAGIDAAYIDIDAWHLESATYLAINISMLITEPTPVDKLVEEVLQATGSALWWDDVNQQVRWQVIRSIPTTADRFTEDNVLTGTLEVTEQPEKRVSRVIVYYGQINPTLKVDETRNYRSTEVVTDELTEFLEGSSAIKTIYAREIAQGGRSVANRIALRYLNRFKRAPRRFKFELLRFSVTAPALGGGYLLGGPNVVRRSWPFQDDTGDWVDIPIQLTRVSSAPDRWIVEAEEMLASASEDLIDTTTRNIFIDSNQNGINLKTIHDSLFTAAVSGDTVNCIINGGITIGANTTGGVAFDVGTGWNSGVTININNGGRIQGCGGAGGNAQKGASVGNPGATAFYTRQAINLTNTAEIFGGGGGGGATFSPPNYEYAGGGGSGTNGGAGGVASGGNIANYNGNNGSTAAGGLGGTNSTNFLGGAGGGPGLAGASSTNTAAPVNVRAGGAAGPAIDGISFITLSNSGSILGSQIN